MELKTDGWYKFDQQTKKMYKVAEPIHVVKKKKFRRWQDNISTG